MDPCIVEPCRGGDAAKYYANNATRSKRPIHLQNGWRLLYKSTKKSPQLITWYGVFYLAMRWRHAQFALAKKIVMGARSAQIPNLAAWLYYSLPSGYNPKVRPTLGFMEHKCVWHCWFSFILHLDNSSSPLLRYPTTELWSSNLLSLASSGRMSSRISCPFPLAS